MGTCFAQFWALCLSQGVLGMDVCRQEVGTYGIPSCRIPRVQTCKHYSIPSIPEHNATVPVQMRAQKSKYSSGNYVEIIVETAFTSGWYGIVWDLSGSMDLCLLPMSILNSSDESLWELFPGEMQQEEQKH